MALSVDRNSLFRSIRAEDFPGVDSRALSSHKEALADEAIAAASNELHEIAFQAIPIRTKTAYRITSLPCLVVLRRLNSILKLIGRIQPSARDNIILCLTSILSEGVPHRLYKFDIQKFFESVDTSELAKQIHKDKLIPLDVSRLIASYFYRLKALGIEGLPRGVPLSATLAEYVMKYFDTQISRLEGVYYFARFVDDIVIVTDRREDPNAFSRSIARKLPFGLSFNSVKSCLVDLPVQRKSNGKAVLGSFDYLGYNFSIHETAKLKNRLVRTVDISIAEKKVRRLKSRISCAVASCVRDEDLSLLRRRLQLLTGNYNVRDISTGRVRNAGLYCSYRRINNFAALEDIDSFLRSIAIGDRGKLAKKLSASLSKRNRQLLIQFSFSSSFKKKPFYNFSAAELASLGRCWRNA